MATVIESLLVELGLDTKKFESGLKRTLTDLAKTREGVERTAKGIEDQGKRAASFFSRLRGEALGLLAIFMGGRGIKEFVQYITTTDAAVGRLARQLDTSSEQLSAWRGVAARTGGTAEGMTGAIAGLVDKFQDFALTGQSAVIPYFRALGISLTDNQGRMRSFDAVMLDLAEAFSKLDPARARAFGRALGFDEATIGLLSRGRDAVAALLEEQAKLNVTTAANAEAATKLQAAWGRVEQEFEAVGRTLLNRLTPAMSGVLDWISGGISSSRAGATSGALKYAEQERAKIDAKAKELETRRARGEDVAGEMHSLELRRAAMNAITAANSPAAAAPAGAAGGSDVDKLMAMGWSREQATGLAARIQRESSGRLGEVGDSGQAFGLMQWHPDRQRDFAQEFGHSIQSATREEQLRFIDFELRRGKEQAAGRALAGATTAAEAGAIASRLYARPRAAAAEELATANLASTMAGRGGGVTTTSETKIGVINVYTQAKDADAIAKDIGQALRRHDLSSQANYGPN